MLQIDKNNTSILYKLLVDPDKRIWRHIILLFGILIISINQAFSVFDFNNPQYQEALYALCIVYFISYTAVGYFNIYVLTVRYFLRKKYAQYFIYILLSMAILVIIQYVSEYIALQIIHAPPGPNSIFNNNSFMIVDISSNFVTITISMIGASSSILLKHWMIENQQISRLENEKVQSELEQLKDQITPDFLSKILNHTSVLAKTEPKKASEMLMKLSMILRYQLYDSSRDKVLLNSEINFVKNYLNLQYLYSDNFSSEVAVEGNIGQTLLPPLLFIPFIQYSINNLHEGKGDNQQLYVCFQLNNSLLRFLCTSSENYSLGNSHLLNIRRRLNLLFPDKHLLNIINDNKTLELELNLS